MRFSVLLVSLLCSVVFYFDSAVADQPQLHIGYVSRPTTEEASVYVLPDGSGAPLTQASLFGGNLVDSRVELALLDPNGTGVVNFPSEDVWIESETGPASACWGQFSSDDNADRDGSMEFTNPLRGGGWSEGPYWVVLSGTRAFSIDGAEFPPVKIRINSADINSDGKVDLSDVPKFAENYYGSYHYRSDFHWDGVIDLSDIAKFAQGLGHNCGN